MIPTDIGQLFNPSNFPESSANLTILGRSGSGKSVTARVGIHRAAQEGVVFHIIDPEGEYSKLARSLNGQVISPGEKLSAEAPVTVLDLHQNSEEEKPQAVADFLKDLIELAAQDIQPRVLVVDEIFPYLKASESSDILRYISKRGRKWQLGLAALTQDVQEFLESEGVVLRNTSHWLILEQDPPAVHPLVDFMGLGGRYRDRMIRAQKGEGLLDVQNGTVWIPIKATPEELETV